jgi:hypothetical protein
MNGKYFFMSESVNSFGNIEKMYLRFIQENNVSTKLKKVHKNTFSIRYTCKRGKILADWIYKDAKLFLNRKFKQYLVMKKTEVVVPEE